MTGETNCVAIVSRANEASCQRTRRLSEPSISPVETELAKRRPRLTTKEGSMTENFESFRRRLLARGLSVRTINALMAHRIESDEMLSELVSRERWHLHAIRIHNIGRMAINEIAAAFDQPLPFPVPDRGQRTDAYGINRLMRFAYVLRAEGWTVTPPSPVWNDSSKASPP